MPPNRFELQSRVADLQDFQDIPEDVPTIDPKTRFLPDLSRTILTRNDSPDVPFTYSINPYRGCEHGCTYCYARPTHETLGFNGGIDFESKIMVKHEAPRLLEEELSRPSWRPEPIAIAGVTDCYQPAERRFRLTRQCLEVLARFRNPAAIVTKSALIRRDKDVLAEMAKQSLVQVCVTVTTMDEALAAALEPRAARPQSRLDAVRDLSQAGIPVHVLISPVIPGLTDHEIPRILEAAKDAGACGASYIILRLPLTVEPVFVDWLESTRPDRASRVKALLRELRGGKLYRSGFGTRMRGEGPYAENLERMFRVFARRFGLDEDDVELDTSRFRAAPGGWVQGSLFGDQ